MSPSTPQKTTRPRRRAKQGSTTAGPTHQADPANPDSPSHSDGPSPAESPSGAERTAQPERSLYAVRSGESASSATPSVAASSVPSSVPATTPVRKAEPLNGIPQPSAPSPDPDPAAAARLAAALDHAARLLDRVAAGPTVHGRRGRSAGRRTELAGGGVPAWLRVLTTPVAKAADRRWQGNRTAEFAFGDLFGDRFGDFVDRRPKLLDVRDWTDGAYAYRAELLQYVGAPRCSWSPAAETLIDLPDAWWSDLRRTLGIVARARTQRTIVHQDWIDTLVPEQLGFRAPTLRAMAPAHGSLHWANLTQGAPDLGPDLAAEAGTEPGPELLGWAAWGRAPFGYDAATLYAHSLPVPELAARVRAAFPELDTADGRVAEIVVTAELLHRIARGNHRGLDVLAPHLRDQARRLRPAVGRVPKPRRAVPA
ncbi:hypothetical protein [Streptodolium elevatio]